MGTEVAVFGSEATRSAVRASGSVVEMITVGV